MTTNNQINNTFPSSGLVGTTTNNNASTGYVGEFISSQVLIGSAVSLTNITARDITSISLTAGDWDVYGNLTVTYTGIATLFLGWISTSSATLPDVALVSSTQLAVGIGSAGISVPFKRISIASTTTIYLSAQCNFTTLLASASGGIYARRAR